MNYSWRADVIQEGMLLALDSDVGPRPKSTNTVHLSADPWSLLFVDPKLSREELPLPIAAFQEPWCYFGAPKGRGKERKFSTILPWYSQKRLTLNTGACLIRKKWVPEAHDGDRGYLFELSCPQDQMCSLSLVDEINQSWSITRTGRAPADLLPRFLPLPYPTPTCSWGQLLPYLHLQSFPQLRLEWVAQEYGYQPGQPIRVSETSFRHSSRNALCSLLLDINPKNVRAGATTATLLSRNDSLPKTVLSDQALEASFEPLDSLYLKPVSPKMIQFYEWIIFHFA